MARHVLIVEKSHMTRRVLQARILAILDDVILSEAADTDEAAALIKKSTIHLALYGWDAEDDQGIIFCNQELKTANEEPIPFVFLVANPTKKAVAILEEQGVANYVKMPCAAKDLAGAIDQACHPSSLRESKRYFISGSHGLIEQRNLTIDCKVLNVSLGGMLCEFEMDAHFNCIDPVMISSSFGTDATRVENIYAILSNIKVVERNTDYTPKLVRMGFKFLNLAEESKNALTSILDQAEENEDSA